MKAGESIVGESNINVVAHFEDRYGETRRIHRTRHGLKVKNEKKTVALHLNQTVGRLIGANIRAKRMERGYSLETLCVRAGLVSATPKSRMWEIENSTRKEGIRLGTLYAIAEALDCNPAELLPSRAEVLSAADVSSVNEKRLVLA